MSGIWGGFATGINNQFCQRDCFHMEAVVAQWLERRTRTTNYEMWRSCVQTTSAALLFDVFMMDDLSDIPSPPVIEVHSLSATHASTRPRRQT